MKRCSVSLVIREKQIKTNQLKNRNKQTKPTSYLFTLTKMARMKEMENTKCQQGCKNTKCLIN